MPLNCEHGSNVPIAAHRVQIGSTDTTVRDRHFYVIVRRVLVLLDTTSHTFKSKSIFWKSDHLAWSKMAYPWGMVVLCKPQSFTPSPVYVARPWRRWCDADK